MSDKANCKNCIHFDEIKRRCCLNDGSWVQKECYFGRNNRKPMGNDVIFEKQGKIIKDLQHQLDQQKARIEELEGQFAYECECNKQFVQLQKMWNELKEWVKEQINFDKEEIEENKEIPNLPNRHYLTIENIILDKIQELEKGEKDGTDR